MQCAPCCTGSFLTHWLLRPCTVRGFKEVYLSVLVCVVFRSLRPCGCLILRTRNEVEYVVNEMKHTFTLLTENGYYHILSSRF